MWNWTFVTLFVEFAACKVHPFSNPDSFKALRHRSHPWKLNFFINVSKWSQNTYIMFYKTNNIFVWIIYDFITPSISLQYGPVNKREPNTHISILQTSSVILNLWYRQSPLCHNKRTQTDLERFLYIYWVSLQLALLGISEKERLKNAIEIDIRN